MSSSAVHRPAARPPAHEVHHVDLDGQAPILVRDFGPSDGAPVIHHHGTPSSSLDLPGGWDGPPDGVRLITFDRPGYGGSGPAPGRTVGEAGTWCARIADHLGLDRFGVMGTSGGGPHAAGAAAVLGERVTRLCVSVGLGPTGYAGFDVEVGLPAETVTELRRAQSGAAALRAFIDDLMSRPDPLAEWMEQLPPADRSVLARPEVIAEEAAITDDALGAGIEGWLDDDLAFFTLDWEVDLAAITAETLLLYGGADVLVPHLHGSALRTAIGHGRLVVVPEGGHWMRDQEPTVLRWLTGADPAILDVLAGSDRSNLV